MRQRNGPCSAAATSQADPGAPGHRSHVLDYHGPAVPRPQPESNDAAIARRVYQQMSQPAPPSVLFAAIRQLMALLALAGALIVLVAVIRILWRAADALFP